MLKSVKAEAPEVIAPEHVASVAVGEDGPYGHYVLFWRAFACGKNVCHYRLSQMLQMYSDNA